MSVYAASASSLSPVQYRLLTDALVAADDLRGRLEALNQITHRRPVDPGDAEAVRAELFHRAGWR